jgi:hypothetical protein
VLQRHDPLPDGVPEQVSFWLGGGGVCFEDEDGPPRIRPQAGLVVPTEFLLCFPGFDHAGPLQVTITPPAGRPATVALRAPGGGEQSFFYRSPRLPGHPLGEYRITARQAGTVVRASFRVVAPDGPRLWVEQPVNRRLGAVVHMYVAGFAPNRTIHLNVYGGEPFGYRTSVPLRVGADGGGHVGIATAADDPPGCYGVSHPDLGDSSDYDPEHLSTNTFCVEAG